MKRHLDIYNNFSNDEIDVAINAWIHKEQHRLILHYKLIDGYTYEETAERITKDTGKYISTDSVKRAVYKAEKALFKHLHIKYMD